MRAALQSSLLFPALSSFCRLTVRDRELLRSLDGPAVFVANHVSALDAVVMAEALPPRYRHRSVVVAAADSILRGSVRHASRRSPWMRFRSREVAGPGLTSNT